jgi:hypothetical protein
MSLFNLNKLLSKFDVKLKFISILKKKKIKIKKNEKKIYKIKFYFFKNKKIKFNKIKYKNIFIFNFIGVSFYKNIKKKYLFFFPKILFLKKKNILNISNNYILGIFVCYYFSFFSLYFKEKLKNKNLIKKKIKNKKFFLIFFKFFYLKKLLMFFTKRFNNPKLFFLNFFLFFFGLNYSRVEIALKISGFSKLSNFYSFSKENLYFFDKFINFLYFNFLIIKIYNIYKINFLKFLNNIYINWKHHKILKLLPLKGQRTRTNYKISKIRNIKDGLIISKLKFQNLINKYSFIRK